MRNHHFRLVNQEVPKTIMESWKRSRKSEVSETLNSAPLVLTEEDINKIKQRDHVHRKTSILKEVFMQKKHETQQDWLLAIDEDGDMQVSNHSFKSFQYIWKSAFDWGTYFQQLQSKKKTDNEHASLPFLHGQPEGKVHPVIDNEKIIGIIVQLPKHSSQQFTTKISNQTSQLEDGVIGQSAPFLSFFSKIKKVAPSHVSVLLTGESGTGKEVFSQTIHRLSDRSEKPFITFNCSSLNHELAASELFGYAPGSFTGGLKEGKKGLFEAADGGVLFLDEIGEIPLTVQPLLLRVLQEKEVLRVGEYKPRKVDVRIIAATNRDLKQMIREGTFREDLYYRLSVINLPIPSLRERKEDILPLAHYFLEQCQPAGRIQFSEPVVQVLQTYDWPGNIRELRNTIEYSVLFVDENIIETYHLPDYLQEFRSTLFVLVNNLPDIGTEKHERENIIQMLKQTNFNVTKAAEMLGFSRGTLYNRLKKYNISY